MHYSQYQHTNSQLNEINVLDELQDYMLTNSFIKKYNKHNINDNNKFCKIHVTDKNHNKLNLTNPSDKETNSFLNCNSNENNQNYQNINSIQKSNKECVNPIVNMNHNKNNEKEYLHFSPHEKDKLFWCFYIFLNGYEKYELENSSSFKIEKEFKFMTAEKLKNLKKQIKELGFKLNDIQEELTSQTNITEKSLLVLCYLYKMNIIYVKNNYYFEMKYSELEETPYHFIVQENNKIHLINTNNSDYKDKLSFYVENYWKIENINKPIKSFSSYTLVELQDICKRLKLPTEKNNKKMLKKELYESIVKVF